MENKMSSPGPYLQVHSQAHRLPLPGDFPLSWHQLLRRGYRQHSHQRTPPKFRPDLDQSSVLQDQG